MASMTQSAQDNDLESARIYLHETAIHMERFRSLHCDQTVLWALDTGNNQIGCVTRGVDGEISAPYSWEASAYAGGKILGRKLHYNLRDALAYVTAFVGVNI